MCIHTRLVDMLLLKDRGIKQASFQVLSGINAPAALVKTAFIDHLAAAYLLTYCTDEFARANFIAYFFCHHKTKIFDSTCIC